jgi:DNA ligase-1
VINEVMLATKFKASEAKFPYLATTKIDGIRFYVQHGDVWSRSNKNIPNIHIRTELPQLLPDGMDGELLAKDYSGTMSTAMADSVVPDITVFVFDYAPTIASLQTPYVKRVGSYRKALKAKGWLECEPLTPDNLVSYYRPSTTTKGTYRICPLNPVWIQNFAQLENFYNSSLKAGHEGIILRTPEGPYRFGKKDDGLMLKHKPREDREAVILGVEEMMTNTNTAFTNERGRASRSTAASGLVPAGTFGTFHVRDTKNEIDFKVGGGPGLTALLRAQLWAERTSLPGKIIKYCCLPYGEKDKPRQPQFLGFRDERDL